MVIMSYLASVNKKVKINKDKKVKRTKPIIMLHLDAVYDEKPRFALFIKNRTVQLGLDPASR